MTRVHIRPLSFLAACAVLSVGCTAGTNYTRPQAPAPPPQHRFDQAVAQAQSIADVPWWEVLKDPVLQGLIREATANNLDLRVATARVEEARAQAGIAKSFLFPQIGLAGGYGAEQVSRLSEPAQGTNAKKTYQNYDYGVGLSWEIDLFGRLRREKEAAFANFVASEHGRRGALVALVSEVASQYVLLRQLDLQIEIARRTVQANDETVGFYNNRLEGGVSNRLEYDRAVGNRARTAGVVPALEQQAAQTENRICLLLGRPPGPIDRGTALADFYRPPQVPAGLPAALLERRPDVLESEQYLVAANANVGAAKALFFPTLSLTGLFGGISEAFGDLFKADASIWSVRPGLFQPLFQGGRIRRNRDAAVARFDIAMAQYQRSALNAYREVADALIAIEKQRQIVRELDAGVAAMRDAAQLARERYDTGLANYLEILNADQQLLDQELQLAEARGGELQAIVQLYRALGGGWKTEAEAAAEAAAAPSAPQKTEGE